MVLDTEGRTASGTSGRFVVLSLGVIGLHGDDKAPKCEDRFDKHTRKGPRCKSDGDKDQPFTCVSDVFCTEGERKKTFVWVLHNDKPRVVLFAKWDDAGMPLVRNPGVCRMVSNETLTEDRDEKKSLVEYGPKKDKRYEPQTYVMADPKPMEKDKDKKEQRLREGKEQARRNAGVGDSFYDRGLTRKI